MFPAMAGEFDQIALVVNEATRVTIYISETESYSDPNTKEIELAVGDTYDVTFPNSLYITIFAHQVENGGDFVISYRFNDRVPEEVLAAMTAEEREQYLTKEVIIKQEKFYEDWMFWLLVVAGLFGVGIMVLLCICLINMKRKNDEIISKVILMSEKQKKQDETQQIDLQND